VNAQAGITGLIVLSLLQAGLALGAAMDGNAFGAPPPGI
jgi:hypothetical protein